jgi:hypothetical protein
MISYRPGLLFFPLLLFTCSVRAQPPEFAEGVLQGVLEHEEINEASGLVASQRNPGIFWTHNDSGDTTRIFALSAQGENRGVWMLEGVSARDWEDIAIGPGPVDSLSYLYVGDIGDNVAQYDLVRIYRLPEPAVADDATGGVVQDVETIICRYEDGARDAEGLLVDPIDGRIYIVTKREPSVRLYRLVDLDGYRAGDTALLEYVATLDSITQVTAADISVDGQEILLKNYFSVYYWQRGTDDLDVALSRPPVVLPYTIEPQGEAIAWGEGGYFTTSEEFQGIPAAITWYRRLELGIEETEEGETARSVDLSTDREGS